MEWNLALQMSGYPCHKFERSTYSYPKLSSLSQSRIWQCSYNYIDIDISNNLMWGVALKVKKNKAINTITFIGVPETSDPDWNMAPHTQTQIDQVENFQHRAACSIKNDYDSASSYRHVRVSRCPTFGLSSV